MLSWSNAKYKLTLGVGSLAVVAMLSELWREVLPVWVALIIALLPLVVFVFVHPGELPARLVRIAHIAASVWYVVVAIGLLVALTTVEPLPRGWPVYPLFVAVGAVPCLIVLYRAARGRYQLPGTSAAAMATSESLLSLNAAAAAESCRCALGKTMNAQSTAEVVIPLSKGKLALLLLGCVVFVAGSIWIWSIADSQTRYNPFYMKGVAIAGVSFFGLCGIFGCFKVLDGRPGLIIDDQGIVDNSSAVSVGRVPWQEIIGLRVSEIAGQRFLVIEVTNPQKYVERCGVFLRMLNAANSKMMGSPLNISSNALKVNFDELVRVLTEALERHRAAGRTRR